ncbi:PTS sugar transporter subunit IIA [Thermoflexus sp.]|uniref:PTS sugar transporter subunit IIA n=1 Tax=Thermoflexus sp. TaxID=1969742 RepID=UPI00261317E0|nr:PTS glucose transporter subunit IIA [Thermoflexus sp.]MCX7689860.1 PTS glucose transporter subunit IIA [Thermoflexus sp.]MDW8065942.1 PTS glucose transporter subunit IIA [Anaerolineae bacterium]MDW8186270.1 PTS glucose transporter subunit IIA [Anaerolineae bacterium]
MVPVLSPFTGRVVSLDEVPDPVFAERMLGEGAAVDPIEGIAVAPVRGHLVVLHSANHAFAVEGENGLKVLVHIGLDTVHLRGEGFERLAQEGDLVEAGQPILRFDLERIRAAGYSLLSPVVLPDLPEGYRVQPGPAREVIAGRDPLLYVVVGNHAR